VSPDFKWLGLDLFVRISNGKNKMAAKTRWSTIRNILASLDRFINKGHKNILFMPKRSTLAIRFFCLDFKWSGYRMSGTGIRYNPNTARGSVFGGLLYYQRLLDKNGRVCSCRSKCNDATSLVIKWSLI
jgi:hypothetical protein